MIVFLDDSGDTGFKFDKNSSRYFVICSVIFDDELEAEKTAVAIKELKRELKISDHVEFKFAKSQKDTRLRFFEKVSKFQYKIRVLVVDKTILHSISLRTNKKKFYSYMIKLLLQNSRGSILDAKIRIDGSGDREFRKSFTSYLRRELNSNSRKVMQDCKLVDSRENVLIQLADMVAGAIHRSAEDIKGDSKIYRSAIEKHIEDIWDFK